MKLTSEEFAEVYGVSKESYQEMVRASKPRINPRSGRGCALNAAEQLLCVLRYWHGAQSHAQLARDWGIHQATVIRMIERVKNNLSHSTQFTSLATTRGSAEATARPL